MAGKGYYQWRKLRNLHRGVIRQPVGCMGCQRATNGVHRGS